MISLSAPHLKEMIDTGKIRAIKNKPVATIMMMRVVVSTHLLHRRKRESRYCGAWSKWVASGPSIGEMNNSKDGVQEINGK